MFTINEYLIKVFVKVYSKTIICCKTLNSVITVMRPSVLYTSECILMDRKRPSKKTKL